MAQGQRRRGILIAVGLLGLFFGGLLVGGIDVIDRQEDGLWFMAQGMVGPLAFATDYIHQNHFKIWDPGSPDSKSHRPPQLRSALPGEIRDPQAPFFGRGAALPAPVNPATGKPQPPPNMKSLGKVNELGTLFCAVAGMMNLIVAIDAAFPRGRRPASAGA